MPTVTERIQEVTQATATGKPRIALDTCCVQYYISNPPVQPWADCLDPVFRATVGGKVELYVSTVVVSELLTHVHFAHRHNTGYDPELDLLAIMNRHFQILDVTGDVLYSMTRPNLRNIAVVPDELDGEICTTGFAVLRPRLPEDTAFIFEIVKSNFFTEAMSRLAEAKSLYPAVDEVQIRQFPVIQPPTPIRAHFGRAISQLMRVTSSSGSSFIVSEAMFNSLLSRSFTGKLTAEWEAANADWVAAQVELQEHLPRLLLLSLIHQWNNRYGNKSRQNALLITALMKYAFLFQMEGNQRRRFHHFTPYHYGPFTKEIYDDLDRLQSEGLVSVEKDADEDKTRISLIDPDHAQIALVDLPEDIKEDVTTIIESYGDSNHNDLLRVVYEKYPAYAKKSYMYKTSHKSSPSKSTGWRRKK